MTARGRWLAIGAAISLLAGAAAVGAGLIHWQGPAPVPKPDGCVLSAPELSVDLDPDQAGNVVTIAAVAGREGMPAHAVTVALATALQESKLRNLDYGHLDSVGLFQQRPSQGWGSAAQIQDPRYAAAKFFRALARVHGWQALPVAEAAQRVQHSADGSAYAQWEQQARALAVAATGQSAAGITCNYGHPSGNPAKLAAAVQIDFGPHALDQPTSPTSRGWAIAGYLVAHAQQFRLTAVSYLGRSWSASTGRWGTGGQADGRVRFSAAAAPSPR